MGIIHNNNYVGTLDSFCIIIIYIITYKYRLYTEVKVSTGFIKPRAEGTRFDKSVETVPVTWQTSGSSSTPV